MTLLTTHKLVCYLRDTFSNLQYTHAKHNGGEVKVDSRMRIWNNSYKTVGGPQKSRGRDAETQRRMSHSSVKSISSLSAVEVEEGEVEVLPATMT